MRLHSLLAETLVSLTLSHPPLFFLLPTPCLFPGSALGRLTSLSLDPGHFNAASLGRLLFTETSKSEFFFGVLYASSDFFNVLSQGLPGVILLLNATAESRVTQVQVILVTVVLCMPLDPVDVAELTVATTALHDGLSLSAAVYLGCTTAEWAPYQVGDSQSDSLND